MGIDNNSESFETGTVTADDCYGIRFLLQITDKKVSYDLSNMFSSHHLSCNTPDNIEYIELIDDKGYDVYYMTPDSNSWMKYNVGTRFGCSVEEMTYRNLDKDYNTVRLQQNYEIKPIACPHPALTIKVEVDGKVVFIQSFGYNCTCR